MKLIYVVCANSKEARKLGRLLIKTELTKCVNILPKMESHYEWKGRIVRSSEAILLVKTTAQKETSVYKKLQEVHSYELPAIFTFQISKVLPTYAKWLSS